MGIDQATGIGLQTGAAEPGRPAKGKPGPYSGTRGLQKTSEITWQNPGMIQCKTAPGNKMGREESVGVGGYPSSGTPRVDPEAVR
jgi:hypothetical protein